eukprot:Lankesteria_metandrocarpae@DN1008_c0_g1_i1.p1
MVGGSYCQCKSGYVNVPGDKSSCEANDPCTPNPCPSSSMYTGGCVGIDMWDYECSCSGQYVHPSGSESERLCTTKDWCTDTGGCSGTEHTGMCTNRESSKECECANGYEHPSGSSVVDCVDIDECATGADFCDKSSSECTNNTGGYQCTCKSGYRQGSSNKSCIDIDECVEGIAQNLYNIPCDPISSQCINLAGSFACACYPGYRKADNFDALLPSGCTGCCVDIDECSSSSLNQCSDYCSNGIVSSPVATNYTCGCWGGRYSSEPELCTDCVYGPWGEWSDCDVTCGTGTQVRQRTALAGQGQGVTTCQTPVETSDSGVCEMPRCITCSTTAWSVWTTCSTTCGGGTQDRSRIILDGNSTICHDTATDETTACNTQSCDPASVDKVALIVSSAVVGGFAIIGGFVVWKLRTRKGRDTNQNDDDGGFGYGNNPYGNLPPNFDQYAPQYL